MDLINQDRVIYFDYLRVFATFSVIVLHVSAYNWYSSDVNGFEYAVFNFFDSIVRWGVPVFVMISGALFLDRDIPLKKLYGKYILRLIVSFIFWSALYSMIIGDSIINRLILFVQGEYHMWFIFLMVGIYMCIPFLKSIVRDDTCFKVRYYLALSFVFCFLIPWLFVLINDFGSEIIISGAKLLEKNVNNIGMHIVIGGGSYFVLGYYLNNTVMERTQRYILYVLGVFGFVFTIVVDLIVALKTQKPCSHYYSIYNVNVLFEAVSVFVWFKYRKYKVRKINLIMLQLSKYSFGAYLVHALVLRLLNDKLGLNTLSFNPALAVVLISIMVFLTSYTVSALLNRIPIVNKFIV